ncbi:MAG: hypothetical protein MJ154_02365 [Candidatus Saccharibacteria bacterium]|nr:hypothetical protein [Candidatus Saccharibacteria bacterium]
MKKKIIACLVAVVAVLMAAFSPVAYATDICSGGYKGNKNDPNYKAICETNKKESDAQDTVKNILNTVFAWVGIVAVIVIIIGGIFYIISQGEPAKLVRAKSAILYAVIGLIVTLLSFAIVNFVLDRMGAE